VRSVSAEYLAAHRETVKNYVLAFAEAAHYVRSHRDAALAALTADFKDLDAAALRTGVTAMSPDPRVSKLTQQWWERGCDFAVKIGATKKVPSFADVFDLTLLHEVEREHPELFDDLPPIPDDLKLS
jgi:ABC-type nitrate/sulfonate/bicarbonate transport system substrate-binding protein